MSTRQRIVKKGYTLRMNTGWRNGQLSIISYTAIKGNFHVTRPNVTKLLKCLP